MKRCCRTLPKNIDIMNNNMKYSGLILTLSVLACLQSCDYDDAAVIGKVELGAPENEYIINASDTTFNVAVYSNAKYHLEVLDGADSWLHITGEPTADDDSLTLYCEPNVEFRRKGVIALTSDVDSRRDTIIIKQRGWKVAKLSMENTSIVADGGSGVVKTPVTTNIPFDYMNVNTEYSNEGDNWIEKVNIAASSDNKAEMEFTLGANPDAVAPRTASVNFSFIDGWGDKVSLQVNLLQKSAGNTLGQVMSFDSFIDKYATGKTVQDYVILEGVVVSNKAGRNAGANEQKTTSAVDYTVSERTVYLEAEDGSRGVSILTATAEDNIFEQYDKVQILMHGTVANLKEEPLRCDITGVTKTMVTSRVSGNKSSVPVKELYIRDLTDNDVYTYVTLKDVEFPVRKGSLVPVNDGYTCATNSNRFTQFPRLVRDINGDDIYLTTNTVCRYRSDGTRLPYGSGKLSGVLVHDAFPRMTWRDGADPAEINDDPQLGNIGRYQLRHQTKDDVWGQMKDNFEEGFSKLLTEYRYWVPNASDSTMLPSYGKNGWMNHTYSRRYTHTEAKEYINKTMLQHMYGAQTFCYLGPVGNGTNPLFPAVDKAKTNKNGCGIMMDLAEDRDQMPSVQSLKDIVSYNGNGTVEWAGPNSKATPAVNVNGTGNNSGKAWVPGDAYTGYSNQYWWDYETDRPYAWLFKFSTAGISTGVLSMQLSMMNQDQSYYAPRFWKAEWSYTDDMSEKADGKWHLISEFSIPDVSTWSNTLFSSSVGFKQMNFVLPLEILGKDNVYIRICPANDLCSDGSDYANAHLKDKESGLCTNAIEYFAIRYNK